VEEVPPLWAELWARRPQSNVPTFTTGASPKGRPRGGISSTQARPEGFPEAPQQGPPTSTAARAPGPCGRSRDRLPWSD